MSPDYQDILKNLDVFAKKKAKLVEGNPVVHLRIVKYIRDKKVMARMAKYLPKEGKKLPIIYEIQFSKQNLGKLWRKYPNIYEREIKKIIAHELAHIKCPGRHTADFRTECKRLGGCVKCGTKRKSG